MYISRKKRVMKFIFSMQINMKVLCKLIALLGLCSQACPKYPKLQVCIIFVIFQGKFRDEIDFLPPDKHKFSTR